jgi:adenylate cyclase
VTTVTLESLAPCLQGLLPAELFTCSKDGIPNAAYLSHVDYVDATHVALSFQFFNKSRRNIAENPQAQVLLHDPDTGMGWRLRLRYVRSETEGPLFDRMALRIEAIASYCGLKGIFRLLAADVYEVLSIAAIGQERAIQPAGARRPAQQDLDPVFTTKALQDLSERIHRADCLDGLLDSILEGLDQSFGFHQSMILVPGEDDRTLVTIATHGYPEGGAGAEVRFGEGIIGMVAEARKPIRISGLLRGMLYAWATAHGQPGAPPPERRIPLPGLANPESQLGVPLLVRGELVGVLCLESDVRYRFHEQDKALIELLGGYVAIAIQNMQLHERAAADAVAMADVAAPGLKPQGFTDPGHRRSTEVPLDASVGRGSFHAVQPRAFRPGGNKPHDVVFYASDECILVDGEYLIRSLPAKILWKLLSARESCGKVEFTNRELRLDKSLNLPEWKDNLESRLLLLRRRLEQKCPTIRLVPRSRGRFGLEMDRGVELSTRP